MTDTDMPSKAPQIDADGSKPEEQDIARGAPEPGRDDPTGSQARDLIDSLAQQAARLGQARGINAAERLMVLDGWVVDAVGTLAYLITRLQAQIMDLHRVIVAAFQGQEAAATVPTVNVEAEAEELAAKFAASRLQAEIDYLMEKQGGGGLTVVSHN